MERLHRFLHSTTQDRADGRFAVHRSWRKAEVAGTANYVRSGLFRDIGRPTGKVGLSLRIATNHCSFSLIKPRPQAHPNRTLPAKIGQSNYPRPSDLGHARYALYAKERCDYPLRPCIACRARFSPTRRKKCFMSKTPDRLAEEGGVASVRENESWFIHSENKGG